MKIPAWTVHESGIAIPQTRAEWWRFINHHKLKIKPPIIYGWPRVDLVVPKQR